MVEFLKRNRLLIGIVVVVILLLLLASIKITKDRIVGFELEFKNCADDTDLVVLFWDKGGEKRPAFLNGDSVLVAKGVVEKCNNVPLRKTDLLKTGEWIELRTDVNLANPAEPPVGYSFKFDDHFLSNHYEIMADTIMVPAKNGTTLTIPRFVYRYNVDSRIKLDYSDYLDSLKLIWAIIRGEQIPPITIPLSHVIGHPCEPKPSDPPGTC